MMPIGWLHAHVENCKYREENKFNRFGARLHEHSNIVAQDEKPRCKTSQSQLEGYCGATVQPLTPVMRRFQHVFDDLGFHFVVFAGSLEPPSFRPNFENHNRLVVFWQFPVDFRKPTFKVGLTAKIQQVS